MLGNLNGQYRTRSVDDDPRRNVDVSNRDFKAWQGQHAYRTSARDMSKQSPQSTKKYAIPGYKGHIPGITADGYFGKTYTQLARDQLNRAKFLPDRTTQLFPLKPVKQTIMGQTLGKFGGGLEDEYHVTSHKYGGGTIPVSHPNIRDSAWKSSYASTHYDQEAERGRKMCRFSNPTQWKSASACARPSTMASGFVGNSTLFDGATWVPDKNLGHGAAFDSEYRGRFNPEKSFHPTPLVANERRMNGREANYQIK